MTPFQRRLLLHIIDCVAAPQVGDVDVRITKGPDEPTVEVALKARGLSFWIYEDEAQVQGLGLDIRFETPDYRDEGELAEAFLAAVRRSTEEASDARNQCR